MDSEAEDGIIDSDGHCHKIMVVEEETVLEVASDIEENMRKEYHSVSLSFALFCIPIANDYLTNLIMNSSFLDLPT